MRLIDDGTPPFTTDEGLMIAEAVWSSALRPEDGARIWMDVEDDEGWSVEDDRVELVARLRAMSAVESRVLLERLFAASLLRDRDHTLSVSESLRLVRLVA